VGRPSSPAALTRGFGNLCSRGMRGSSAPSISEFLNLKS